MSDYLKSVVRTAIQLGWGAVVVWLVHHNVNISNNVSNWVVDGSVSLIMLAVTAAIRYLESSQGTTGAASVARSVGRLIMLGVPYTPKYTAPAPPAPAAPAPPTA